MMRFASHIYIYVYIFIYYTYAHIRSKHALSKFSRNFLNSARRQVVLQTNEKATTVLIIVNNSTFIFLFWLILVVINELRIFFTARILSINVFRLYEQQTKMNISSYTEKFDAPIRRVIKVYKRLSFVVYMYICVCASFFFPQLKVRTSLAR